MGGKMLTENPTFKGLEYLSIEPLATMPVLYSTESVKMAL